MHFLSYKPLPQPPNTAASHAISRMFVLRRPADDCAAGDLTSGEKLTSRGFHSSPRRGFFSLSAESTSPAGGGASGSPLTGPLDARTKLVTRRVSCSEAPVRFVIAGNHTSSRGAAPICIWLSAPERIGRIHLSTRSKNNNNNFYWDYFMIFQKQRAFYCRV